MKKVGKITKKLNIGWYRYMGTVERQSYYWCTSGID